MRLWNNIFEQIVKEHQAKKALVYEENCMTYAELDVLSDQVARSLQAKGIGRESIVAVMLERSIEYVAAIFGIWKAGAAYVAIDLTYPKDRIDFMLRDCDVKTVINKEYIDGLDTMELADLPTEMGPHDLAAVIYTSGSTGNPKGVLLEQKSMAMTYHDLSDPRFGSNEDIFMINASITFVAFIFAIILAMGRGMEVHLSSDRVRKDINQLTRYIKDHQVTITFATPQVGQFLTTADSPLKTLLIGGDKAISFDCNHVQVINMLGLSEVNGAVTNYFCQNSVQENTPVGTPMSSVKLYLLDDQLNPVEKGKQGQICLAGPKVARGYLNRPDITAEKFIHNPFSTNEDETILFLTGDVGRELADGNIEYVNRNDWMMNINGFRVEPGEIENQIKKIPAIKEAVVKGFLDRYKQNFLGAFYTVKQSISPDEIKAKIAEFLPDYMIPSFFVELPEIPLNPNGKVDRKSLRAPEFSGAVRAEYQKPNNEKEAAVCKAFEQILGIEQVGIHDNFFLLGGDSIKAMKLQLLCSNLNVTMTQIMQEKTPAKIAKVAAKNIVAETANSEVREYYPLTENQLGLYVEWEKDRTALQYNLPEVIKFSKQVSPKKLEDAVRTVIKAHPYLKTCLGMENGQVVQLRNDNEPVHIVAATVRETDIQNIKETFVKPFDLFQAPLYRSAVYQTEQHTYLFMDIHHIIADGSSFDVFHADLVKAYTGQEVSTETYMAFEHALEEEQLSAGETYRQAEAFFDGQRLESMTELPKSVQGVREGHAKSVAVRVDGKSITQFCRDHGVTPSNLFLSALCISLNRYTREEDITVTTIFSGRNASKQIGMMGMLVKTLPIVVHMNNNQKALELIEAVQTHMLETMEHQIFPFTKMAEKYKIVPQINYAYQGGILEPFALDGQWADIEMLTVDNVQFPLALSVRPQNGEYEISIDYDDGLYTQDYIKTFAGAMGECAKQMAENSEQSCGKVAIISKETEQKLLNDFRGKTLEYDKHVTFIDLFIKQVEKNANNIALIDEKSSLTYGKTDVYTDLLAKELVRLGVKENTFVGIMLPRRKEFMISVIGTMKAGGAYVPLDNEYPQERIEYMLEDSQAKVLITEKSIYQQKGMHVENVIFIDEFDFVTENNKDIHLTAPTIENVAYMIYTSGSTGKPKGVMIRHKSLAALLAWWSREYQLTEKDNICSYSSFSFDASVENLFTPLSIGCQLHIISEEMRLNMHELNQYFHDHNITGGTFGTQFGMELLNQFEVPLRFIALGGEKLKPVKKRNTKIINEYGPTEFTVDSSYHVVDQDKESENIPIGKPVPNSWAYVVDKNNNLMPIGAAGELCLAGVQIALGYWNRKDLTKEKFINNPFKTCEKNTKMYRTGDLVRWNKNGELEYVGRIDNQVKLRGFRIELGEIESTMARFAGITASVAEIKELGSAQHLCAYFTADSDIDTKQLCEYLRQSLTEYMVPTAFMQLDKLPLTPNGKVNRKALPEPVIQRQELVAPQTETQQRLFDLAADILGTQNFGITDDLFSVGLTSMLAIKMSVGIYKQCNINIKTNDIFKNKTIEKLAEIIKNTAKEEAIETFAKREYYPLTENQLGLYYEWEKDRTALQYNIPEVTTFSHKVDPHKLQAAAKQVIEAHPYLKTCLGMKEGQVVQLRKDDDPVHIEAVNVKEENIQTIKETFVKPFDLFAGPLYRIAVYYTDQFTYLFMDIHHIVIDGSALGVFMDDLVKAYKGEKLIQETYTAFEHALEAEQQVGSQAYQQAEKFFDSKLSEGMTELPHVAKGENGQQATVVTLPIQGESINNFCKENAITPNNLFLSALCTTLSRYTREERIAIAAISSGRNENKLNGIMGMLVKTLPFVVQVKANEKVIDYVNAVQDNMFKTMANEIYPFTKMVERHRIVPRICYAYQGGMTEEVELEGQAEQIEVLGLTKTKFPVTISVSPKNGDFELNVEFDDSLYTNEYIETFASAIAECAKRVTENPEQSCGKLAIISKETEQKLLNDFQGKILDYDKNATFIDLFKKQVEKNANDIALVDEKSSLTYEKTDAYTDRLAQELVRLGVKENTFVGIMLPRRKEFMVSVIATMKAGGAYVPLDNEYPQQRIEYMLKDSGAKVLITQKSIYEQKGVRVENVIFIDGFDFVKESNQDITLTAPSTENVAYMIYTSGSTGKPKGVMIRHKSLAAFLVWRSKDYQLTEKDNLCCHSSFSFDASVYDLFVPLVVGSQLHIISEEMRQNMHELNQYIKEHHITDGTFSTQLGMELLNQFDVPMKSITLGGEKLKAVKKTNTKIVNGYGPTEFTICSSYHVVDQTNESDNIPIGKPVANSWAYVVDASNNLMPIGVAGELCIAGAQIALGYWHREDLTKEKFIDNPFKTCEDNAKMYRTGDLACWNENGELEYLGRIDNQVKLRGFRIELGEIESAMAKYAGITASVAEIKEIGKTQHLCGYFTANIEIDTNQLREYLSQSLTEYMVPTVFVQLDKIPLTPNGKVDRKALPEPVIERQELVLPQNEMQQQLFDLVATILGTEEFGITDDLFRVGLTSILAIKVSVGIYNQFNTNIKTNDIFKHKTIEKLEEIINNTTKEEEILVFAKREYYPLTENQLGLYYEWEKDREALQYNIPQVIKFPTKVDPNQLKTAVEKAITAHPYLKTCLGTKDGQIVQLRKDDESVFIEVAKVSEEEIKNIREAFVKPFDLFTGPLYRIAIYYTANYTYLFMDIHHIIIDGSALGVFTNDLLAAYKGEELNRENYTAFEYALEEAQMVENEKYLAAESFFDSKLGDSMTELPKVAKGKDVGQAESVVIHVPGKKIAKFCKENAVTPSNLFLAALCNTLTCYTREERVAITTISSGRNENKLNNIMGMFVKTLPVVVQLNPGEKAIDCVKAVQENMFETMANEIYPFTKMAEKHKIVPQINYAYQGGMVQRLQFEGQAVEIEELALNKVKFPVSISVCPHHDSYEISIEYDDSLYTADYIETLSSAIAECVTQIAERPNMLCRDICIANNVQIKMLEQFNQTHQEYKNQFASIVEMFKQQASRVPDNIAIVYEQKQYTYKELDQITDKLAKKLKMLGVGAEQAVGVLIDRSEYMVIYPLAILKAGGAYMPLDYTFPTDRLEFMIKDAGLRVILSEQNRVEEQLPQFGGTIIKTDDLSQLEVDESITLSIPAPNDMFVILYTSGSTGMPKGCVLENHNLVNYCQWHQAYYSVTENDRAAAYANFGFDVHMLDIYPYITCGAAVYIIPSDMRLDFIKLNQYFEENQLSIASMTTQLGRQYVEQFANKSLRALLVAGEKLLPTRKPSYHFYNGYGPTECTILATVFEIKKDYDSALIGSPLDNYQLYVVDTHMQLLPIGVAGELCIGGDGVGRGYLNREDVTNEKFVLWNGKRIYRTGDLARWTNDGEIEYLGRMDGQVKLRGLRIELGEIESQIVSYAGIISCAVAVKEIGGAQHLCAYYTAEIEIDVEKLKEQLATKLTAFMIPTVFMQLDKLPLTSNGKVNRKALPEPVIERQELVLPQNAIQQQLFDLVATILETEEFGITDDLFRVGLTSILAIKVSVGIYNQFNTNIKTNDIFKHKTIEKLEKIINNTTKEQGIAVFAKREFYPLTENQRGLYYEWEKDREALQYNTPQVIKFPSKVDPNQLKGAVEKVVEAHPYLKTCLGMKDGQVVQLRKDNESVCIACQKVNEAEIKSIKQTFVQPFDLFTGPLYRIAVYYTDKHTYLFMDIHHIIIDGSALGVFTNELIAVYKGEELNRENYTAFEYALEEAQMVESEKYLAAEKFFGNLLGDNMTQLPKIAKGESERQARFVVSDVHGKSIAKFCRENAVTPSNLFLAALCNTLTRYTREERIAITTISSGRNETKLNNIMGMFVKTLPVVVQFNPGEKVAAYVKAVQENMFETMANEIYPFTKMVEKHKIVPQINYVYQGGIFERLEVAGQVVQIEGLALNKTKFPLAVSISPKNEDYEISIEYDDSLYTYDYIETLSNAIAECAKQMAENPKQSCGKLAIISKEAEQKLLNDFRGKTIDYDKHATFIDLFKKQVEKSTNNIALIDEKSSLTYGKTDVYTDRLAKELVHLGVKENTFVGIMLPRRNEFMVSVIGTMKAGGAYVPLDNEYPQDRIQYMLEDSGAKVLITEKSIYEQKGMHVENVIFIDEFDFVTKSNQNITLTAASKENVAYMIYTSGSTGKPKGVMIGHKSLAALLAWRTRDFQLTEQDNLCCHSSFSFDASVDDLFTPLVVGGQLHIISEEMRQNMFELNQYFHEHNITGATFSTQFGMELINQFDLPLRYVIMGGEKLKAVKKTHIKLINGYGPTEFTVCSSYHIVNQDKDDDNIPIGKPVANSWAYIVDKNYNLMPKGVPGELCMAGCQLALGYWNREDLTKEKFIDNPFKTCEENSKMYRTGDLACWNEVGELEYLGRIDNQVKLRGFRIELGEIESAMAKFAGITASIAEIKEIDKTQHLCGYFTADTTINTDHLREHLATTLTEYMVPAFLVQLASLPLTPNGKVDRKALPIPEMHNHAAYVAPRNDTEAILASVFEMILGVQQVGIDDSFFAMGGDSIKAIRMVSKLREKDVFVTVPMVMKGKTIRAIAQTATCQDTTPTIEQEAVEGQVPLTFIQSYFFGQNLPRPHHFNQSMVLASEERVDETLLRQTLHTLTVHHDMLRAVYDIAGRQEIRPVESQYLYSLFTYEYQENDQWQSAMEADCNKMQASIDLATGPMLQAGLFRTPSTDLLFIAIHHLVVDGISWRILIEDINNAYRQAKQNKTIMLPAKTASFKAWSAAIGRYRTSYALKQEIPYWEKVQNVLPAGCIPVAVTQEQGFGNVSVAIDEAQTRALVSTASEAYHTEVNDLLLCALCRAVHKVTGQTNVSVDLEGHGREPIGEDLPTDRTVGWFTSVYPVAFTEIGADIRSDIRRVKETLRQVPNHGIGYGILQYIGEPALDQEVHPDISFNYLGELSEEHTAELFVVDNQAPQGHSAYEGNTFGSPIALNGLVKDKQLFIDIGYDRAKYSDARITQLGDVFVQELKTLVDHCLAVETPEITAADLGEIAWSDSEFEALLQQTQAKGWEVERIYPLTPLQEGMLFHRLAEPDSTSYFLQNVFHLNRSLSEDLLKSALYHLGQKHEVLRTAILYKGLSESRQAILKGRDFEVCQVDISGYADTEEQLETIKRLDIQRGFDLQDDPLLRVILVKLSDDNYRLIWSTHHIIVDGWCLSILMNDFANICNNLYVGQEYVVEPKPITRYEDYVRSVLAKDKETAHTYWKNLLLGYSTEATIRPLGTPEACEEQENTITYQFSRENTEQIKHICNRYDVTINTAVEAAWGLVLQKYNNTDDVVFGKVVSGRNTSVAGAEEMVGLFINTIPVRVQATKDETLGSLFQKVQQQAIDSTQYDTCALAEVQQLSDAGSSLIGTIMAFENYHIVENTAQQHVIDFMIEAAREQTNYGITIVAYLQEVLTIGISYHTNLYGKEEIARILEAMTVVLAENPNVLCKDISVASDEQIKMLERFNQTHQEYKNQFASIVEMFKQQVCRVPDNIAVVYEQKRFTYKELDQITDKLAKKLKMLGVGAEQVVGVLIDRSEYMAIYPLAIVKAGGAYMPLDYSFPTDRLEFMIKDADVQLILSEQNRVEEHLPQFGGTIIKADDISQLEVDESITLSIPAPNDMFVVFYTSGSTGMPKGCVLENHNLVNYCQWHQSYYRVTENDRSAAYANFAFDASMLDLYPFITCGASAYIIPSEMRLDFIKLNQYFEENYISIAFMTTQLGRQFIEAFDNKSIRALTIGGEKLFSIKKPPYKFYNAYGPTECTLFTTVYEIMEDYDSAIIGSPIDNYELYVLDDNMQLMPIGAAGELCIGGAGVGRGYLNREDVTNEKFIIWNGKRIYRTGDLVRWTNDGEIEYIGRMDGQVKLRGLRIELGEIEAQILSYEGITNCAVAVKEIGGTQQLSAYYTAESEVDVEKLKEQIAAKLTAFMIPTAFTQLDKLPLTSNGKVDRKALPMPELLDNAAYVAPRNDTESILAAVFEAILNVQQVGIDDSFFALGGDSIKAIRMVSKLREKDVFVTVPMVMQGKTIRSIAQTATRQDLTPTIEQEVVVGQVPLTFIQSYFFGQNLPRPHHFNQSMVLESVERVDETLLRQTLHALTVHHDMLRAVYDLAGRQEIRPVETRSLYTLTTYEYQENDQWQNAMEAACNKMQASIELITGPMLQAGLFRTPSADMLFIVIHHLVVDGVSWRILIEDINTSYRQAKQNKTILLPAKTASFKAWSQAIGRYRTSYALKQEIPYWKKIQEALPAGCIPGAVTQATGYSGTNVVLDEEKTRILVSTASVAYHTEVNDLLLCALCRAIHQVTGQTTVSVALEGHGREPIGENLPIDRTVGWFTSIYPVVFTEIGANVRSDIRRVKEILRRVPNHGIGYGILEYISEPALDKEIQPDISFNYLGELSEEHSAELFIVSNQAPQGQDVYEGNTFGSPIALNGLLKDKQLMMSIGYDRARYSEARITQLADAFAQELEMLISHCLAVETPETTAADLGEIAWSDQEFEALLQQTQAKGWEIERIYPLTPMQEGMLFHRLAEPDSTSYFVQSVFRLTCAVSGDLVEKALCHLGQKHEVLRTAILYKNLSESRQAILKGRAFAVSQVDISAYTDIEEQFETLKQLDIQRGFDLQEDSLLRVILVKISEADYRLIWSTHHIIIDGWCLSIVMNDFMNICNTLYAGQEYVNEQKTVSRYEDYVRSILSVDKEAARTYWKNLLLGYATAATIRPLGTPEGGLEQEKTITYQFSKETTERIQHICSRYGVTINTAVEVAWGLVLQKYNNTDDVVFGKVVSGRNTSIVGAEEMVGLFINTIPVRVQAAKGETLGSLMQKVQQQGIESTQYDFCALAEVQQLSDVGSSLIGTIMAFENYHVTENNAQQHKLEFIAEANREQTNYGISLIAYLQETLTIGVSYHTNLYGEVEVARILEGIAAVLANNPEQSCRSIAIISKEDEQKIRNQFQGKVLDYDRNSTFLDLFSHQVGKTAANIALVDETSSLTYQQTDQYTASLAKELVRLGVSANTFVGIMLPRRKEFMLSVIGTMKAGGAYVPLDNEYPQDRIQYMLEDSGAKVLITEKSIYEQKGLYAENVIFIDEFDFVTASNQNITLTAPAAEDLAYMIYTSGSTGKPKGVMIRHKSLAAFLAWRSEDYQLTEQDNICCHSSFSFDASVYDLFVPLVVGGQLHIISEEMRQNMHELNQYIKEHHITDGTFSTQLGMELLNQFDVPLKSITLGGEKLKAVKKVNTKIVNGYGPTEFTICSSYHVVDQDHDGDNIPIGKPVANSWSYVVDENYNLLPIGVAGELCLAGTQIALGYWNRQDLTTEKFIDNPYKTCEENSKMYRTGDLACWNENGELEYVGRIDNQVKLRGFRIELGEIESAIAKFDGITASAADIKEIGRVQHICGYFTANQEIDTNKLREYLAQSLTEYMVPTGLLQLDKIPLTPNGKVNKKALPAIELMNCNEYVAPTNELEEKLCTIFAETLTIEKVGITDSFFDLGGTSLLAMRVVVKAMAMDIGITYANIFKYQNPQNLADFLSNKGKESSSIDVSAYDYSVIDQILAKNTLSEITVTPLGDILLTGATGFLGIHILREFLENYPGKVYCLMRSKDGKSADVRLKVRLVYYFDNDYNDLFGKRIFTVEGDITNLELINVDVDTVVNCAANVKHFAVGDELEKVNVEGVRNVIKYCQDHDASLVHVSTTSVAGAGDASMKDSKIKETQLYLGQLLDNKYIYTKFLAERFVLAAVEKGLKAKIMRVGNLMSRSTDGEFQLNFKENSFMGRLKAFKLIGKFPVSLMSAEAEFSPIDSTASAILKLAQTNSEYTVFHPCNNHDIYMADIIYAMKEYGFTIEIVSEREFEEHFKEKLQDETITSALTGLLAYQTNSTEKPTYGLGRSNEFTSEVLYRLNFRWPVTSELYVKNAIEALDSLGFFDARYKM